MNRRGFLQLIGCSPFIGLVKPAVAKPVVNMLVTPSGVAWKVYHNSVILNRMAIARIDQACTRDMA